VSAKCGSNGTLQIHVGQTFEKKPAQIFSSWKALILRKPVSIKMKFVKHGGNFTLRMRSGIRQILEWGMLL
jgi:hypothetical protein